MVDYSNGKIYRIVCNNTGKVYIGSTTDTLSRRLTGHKSNYNKYINGRYHYVTSFEIIKNNNFSIVLIENVPCKNKEELFQKERYYIENTQCVNKQVPLRTMREYINANIEKRKKTCKKYNDTHKDKHHEYYINNKDSINEKRKLYYEKNRDSFIQRAKKHYEQNISIIKTPFQCECGATLMNKSSKSKHLKTQKHLKYLESLKSNN